MFVLDIEPVKFEEDKMLVLDQTQLPEKWLTLK